jgi:phosphoglycolate phosphatase
MQAKAVIFDLDGTLLDTLRDIADSANATLVAMGYPSHPVDQYKVYVGKGIRDLGRKALPDGCANEGKIDSFVDQYREIYKASWDKTSKPYLGIGEMLDTLAAAGVRLGVLSNKIDDFTRLCVSRLLSRWKFEIVRGEVRGVPCKPDPQGLQNILAEMTVLAAEVLYVGDSEVDVETAQRAGVACAAVTWGFRSRDALFAAGAKLLADQPSDVVRFAMHME